MEVKVIKTQRKLKLQLEVLNNKIIMKKYIPKTKDDINAIHELKNYAFEDIKGDIMVLLEWMQDMHWDISHDIAIYFRPYVNEIEDDLITILESNDEEWKHGVLCFLIGKSSKKLSRKLVDVLKRIADKPNAKEIEAEINILALDILNSC